MRVVAAGLAAGLLALTPARAVIVLDSTWAEEGGAEGYEAAGFGAHIDFANEPQFDALISFSSTGEVWGECSGTWLGNDGDTAYVLTAAHCFELTPDATTRLYRTQGGTVLTGLETYIHPEWTGIPYGRTGYDIAIVVLDGAVTDAGEPPALYGGQRELGRVLTFVGFGSRGIGSRGQDDAFYAFSDQREQKAAAQGRVDEVAAAVLPIPADGSGKGAGNSLAVFFPSEDGSLENPYGGPNLPVSRLAGLLGSGDSGGSAWIQFDDGTWVIAGINANGSGTARYGDTSWFNRVSFHRDWIQSIFPGAIFVED